MQTFLIEDEKSANLSKLFSKAVAGDLLEYSRQADNHYVWAIAGNNGIIGAVKIRTFGSNYPRNKFVGEFGSSIREENVKNLAVIDDVVFKGNPKGLSRQINFSKMMRATALQLMGMNFVQTLVELDKSDPDRLNSLYHQAGFKEELDEGMGGSDNIPYKTYIVDNFHLFSDSDDMFHELLNQRHLSKTRSERKLSR